MVVGGGSGVCVEGGVVVVPIYFKRNGMNHESCRKEWVGNVPIF